MRAEPANSRRPDTPPRSAPAADALRGARVLIAEDRPELLAAITRIIRRAGADPLACDHPADAETALRERPASWDLLITDFEMPHMTGAELTLRARALAPHVGVVLCTGLGARDRELRAPGLRFDAVILKPVRRAALIAAAQDALRR